MGFAEGYTLWWPVQEPKVLPRQFLDAFEFGDFNRVPIINGTTRDEATLLIWLSHNFRFKPLKADQYLARLTHLTGSEQLAAQVAGQYPLANYDSPYEALSEAFSDGFFNCLSRRQAGALSTHVPVWNYQFDYDGAPFYVPWADLRAYHAAELQYLAGRPWSFFRSEFRQEERALSDSMMGYWARFARSGNPNAPGTDSWPVFDQRDLTLLFNLQNSVGRGVHEEACRFWDQLPYLRPPYA